MKILKVFRLVIIAFMIGLSNILPVPLKDNYSKTKIEWRDPKDEDSDEDEFSEIL